MASRFLSAIALPLVLGLLSSCTGSDKLPEVYLLTGECKIEVTTPHDKAHIYVDGVHLGQGRVSSDVPCGDKLVEVQLDGYKPYSGYHMAQERKTALVPVKLEVMPKTEFYALSDQLIADIREGKVGKGAVEGGASKAAVEPGAEAEAGPTIEDINWDDWS